MSACHVIFAAVTTVCIWKAVGKCYNDKIHSSQEPTKSIELSIGEVSGINYTANQTLCFFNSDCESGMGIDKYLCQIQTCKQNSRDEIEFQNKNSMYYIHVILLAPDNSLDLVYLLRINDGTEVFIVENKDRICSQQTFVRHMIFKQKPQQHTEPTDTSKYKQQRDGVAISLGILLPISIVASIAVTCLVIRFKESLCFCQSKNKVKDSSKA